MKETRETASNEPTEAVAAMQVASPDKHVPTGKGSEDGATETVLVTEGLSETWLNRNMRRIIYEDACTQPEAVSGTEYAVCYLDPKRGTFSNAAWRAWFSSDTAALLDGSAESTTTFLAPCVQFPYTTHYTVMASDGHIHKYSDHDPC